jgi:hypothetical protein
MDCTQSDHAAAFEKLLLELQLRDAVERCPLLCQGNPAAGTDVHGRLMKAYRDQAGLVESTYFAAFRRHARPRWHVRVWRSLMRRLGRPIGRGNDDLLPGRLPEAYRHLLPGRRPGPPDFS